MTGTSPQGGDHDDWDDRLTDRALRELHGERPPDLAARILARLQQPAERQAATPRHLAPAASRPAALRRFVLVLAAALVAMLLVLWPRPKTAERLAAVQVVVELVSGGVTVAAPGDAPPGQRVDAGASTTVLLRRGDRLHTHRGQQTEMFLGPFGLVRTEPQTSLEVREMDVSLKNGWVAAGSLTLAVVAGAASWHLLTRHEHAEAGEVLRLQAPDVRTATAALTAENEQLKRDNEDLRQRLLALEQERARQPIEPTATVAAEPQPVAVAPTPVVAAGPTFDDERYTDALAKVDWASMGTVTKEMSDLLVKLVEALDRGEDMPMEVAVEIGKLNMKLVEQLPELMKAGLPGTGPNGVFSHPLVVGNHLASLLQQAGQPLSEAQRSALAAAVRHYTGENDGIHGDSTSLGLEKVLNEAAMKERLYDEAANLLSPEQRRLMYPEGAGRYNGSSLFRSGILWSTVAEPIEANSAADYATQITSKVERQLGFDAATAARIRAIIEQNAAAAPAAVWSDKASPAERSAGRFLRSDRAPAAAATQVAWMRQVLRDVPMSDEQRKKLQSMSRVFVPLPR